MKTTLLLGHFPLYYKNMENLDEIDRKILKTLQKSCDQSLDQIADTVGLSRNACWKRIKSLETKDYILNRVAHLNPSQLGVGLKVYMMIKADRHDPKWLEKFAKATRVLPEIMGAHRMSGDLDYLVWARVPDVEGYDRLYKRLISHVEIADVSASFVMETLKDTHELPI